MIPFFLLSLGAPPPPPSPRSSPRRRHLKSSTTGHARRALLSRSFQAVTREKNDANVFPYFPCVILCCIFLPSLQGEKKRRRHSLPSFFLLSFFLSSFLKPVDLQRRLLHDLVVREERRRAHALVALQLDDGPQLGVVDDGAVAAELLLEGFDYLFVVERLVEPLDGGQGLAAVALLDADVDIVLGRGRGGAGGALGRGGLLLGVGGVGKRVWRVFY